MLGAVALCCGAVACRGRRRRCRRSRSSAYLALIGNVVAFLVYFWLLDRTSLLVTSTLVFVFPLVALATDAVFEHAIVLGPRAYLGAGVTLAGLSGCRR